MDTKPVVTRTWIHPILTIFALIAAAGAVLRMTVLDDFDKRFDETTLTYLAVAGALLLLREVKSLAFGNYKVEFERKLEELETKVENAQAAAVGGSNLQPAKALESVEERAPGTPSPGTVPNDPWKGAFNGQSESGTRKLDAEVTPIGTPGLYRVRLQVYSTNPKRDPLRGSVQFFLHPTFRGNDKPVVAVTPNGTADLALTAWGAFTVGAIADNGATKLELDLAKLASAPAEFKLL